MVSAFSEAKDESEEVTFRKIDLSEDEETEKRNSRTGTTSPALENAKDNTANQDATTKPELQNDRDMASEDEDEDVYVVEQIIRHRRSKKARSFEYLVRWEGYGSEDDTWEPHDNIAESASALVDTYWAPRGGYDANKTHAPNSAATKRKRASNSADVLVSNTVQSKRRKQGEAFADSSVVSGTRAVSDNVVIASNASSSWHPPLELKSWEELVVVETLEKDVHNELFVYLEWPKEKERSRHKASVAYQKLPQSMLRFYEANIVFKPAKTN
ncbi:Chromo domain-containing protein [Taphrina deformans PYCC 5710]|uniref:Chromo domain-containing protein n=1 Tax=Taphrina deformans (strain PYCC 5710 / ATCC 11124 / CBS 356.35 / IMI 108563 / JCM 9778 / NBRC 8474) TaxID=1097556 RepID=R4X6L0_TAPDE|nr:Chromo domain-containing protein [Taphrina deformans PYCC 5710]|eukprot:CCG80806.1 Chromo domain-containing protein [Taphrina deformans PYCC 5710]